MIILETIKQVINCSEQSIIFTKIIENLFRANTCTSVDISIAQQYIFSFDIIINLDLYRSLLIYSADNNVQFF